MINRNSAEGSFWSTKLGQAAMASIAAQRQALPDAEPILDWATLRMNRFFYRFGFACLGLALIVSWISTRY
mgnify:CR=1 FL=1